MISGATQAMKRMFYDKFLAKFFRTIPPPEVQEYFNDQAWTMWASNIDAEDFDNLALIEWICLDLQKTDEDGLAMVVSTILDQKHDIDVISNQALKSLNELKPADSLEKKYQVHFEAYKSLYEGDLRLWGTIPFLYACEKIFRGKKKLPHFLDYVEVGATTKLMTLRDIKIELPKGKIRSLVVGFNNKLRNASSGHNRWEITDKGTALLKIVDPYSGKKKEEIELNLKDLREHIRKIQGKLSILETGVMIFLTNHPSIKSKIKTKATMKIKEIEQHAKEHARNFQLGITKFQFDRNHLSIVIKKESILVGEKGEIFMGDGTFAEVASVKHSVGYEDNMLSILQLVYHLNGKEEFTVDIKVLDDNSNTVFDLEYNKNEIKKLISKADKPRPHRGVVTEQQYELFLQFPVKRGLKEILEKEFYKKHGS